MIMGKHGAVICRETRLFVCAQLKLPRYGFKPITAPYLTMIIKPRKFAKRQCKLQWLTPPAGPPGNFGDASVFRGGWSPRQRRVTDRMGAARQDGDTPGLGPSRAGAAG